MNVSLLHRVDHLVYATNDLEASCAELERRLGVRPSPGGRHLGRGTRNALIAIGPASYLEIVGPDPEQPAPAAPRWFDIDRLGGPRLVAWAARTTALQRVIADGVRHGVRLGAISSGSRLCADGVSLSWTFTDPTTVIADGLVPFFIDWGTSPHPAGSAAGGVELVSFSAEHPDPAHVRKILEPLGIELQVDAGPHPALIATIRTATGLVQIR
ncbi:MAG TPA: VOC family protein [Vicinamibacterales bacterium]|nr:VOC family protein [Vicinamibacterales bacterium]